MSRVKTWVRAGILGAVLFVAAVAAAHAAGLGTLSGASTGDDGVTIKFTHGLMKVSRLEDGIIRVRATGKDTFAKDLSFALAPDAPKPGAIKYREDESGLTFETGLVTLTVSREGGAVKIMDKAGNVLLAEPASGGISFDGDKPQLARLLPSDEHYYGFGEKTGKLDKRGTRMIMWNTDSSLTTTADPLYESHPYYLALRKGTAYGVFLDNSYRSSFDVGKTEPGMFKYTVDGGEINYYFLAGPSPKDVVTRYGTVVGHYPLPPLWATGYMQCRYSYWNEKKVREITSKFRQYSVPCDVVFLDIHYMDNYKVFTFNKRRFPDPAGMMADLEKQGFKVITIIDPGVKVQKGYYVYDQGMAHDYFTRDQKGGYFKADVWPKAAYFPDFTRPEVREWWGGLHKFLLDLGVAGIWDDMNEPAGWKHEIRVTPDLPVPLGGKPDWLNMVHGPRDNPLPHALVHNAYALLENWGTYEGLKKLRPDSRPFVISRAAYSGVQKYSSVWTGDNFSNWAQLEMTPATLLNLGISGITMNGADIGGFVGAANPELYARWLEQGVFYPFCRTHKAIYMQQQDPFSFGKDVREISKKVIELRYRLLPYSYSYFKQASETGLPVMRAMFLEFPGDEKTYNMSSQYMWGESLLVAPVTKKGAQSKTVYLPEGKWYRFETSAPVAGGKEIAEPVTLGSLPLFAREGAIVPLAPVMNYTGEKPWSPLAIEFYRGSRKSCFKVYEDDGRSFNYEKGEYLRTEFCQEFAESGMTISKSAGDGSYRPAERELALKIFGAKKPGLVQISNGPAWDKLAYSYDPSNQTLEFRVKDQVKGFEIRVSY